MELDTTAVVLEAGSASLVGVVMGYAAKKVAKVIAVIIGLQLVLFKLLESRDILIVDWGTLTGSASSSADLAVSTPPAWLDTIISTLSVGAGFTVGFLLGFKKA